MISLKPITIPRRKIVSAETFVKKIDKAFDTAQTDIKAEYKKTVRGWKRKPTFSSRVGFSGGGYVLSVYPSGKNAMQYIWVDLGTKPHRILPRVAPKLVFYANFKPRTRKGWIGSGTQKYSPPQVAAHAVNNPGISSRDFSDTISRQYQTRFTNLMNRAMELAAKQYEE